MAESHPLEEIVTRPGVYFNPQTEVLIVVDDSAELDGEIFNMEEFEGSDWVQISDEIVVDEERRDELLLAFQTALPPGRRPQHHLRPAPSSRRRATTRRTTRKSAREDNHPE